MHIFVKTFAGKNYSLDAAGAETVHQLKHKIGSEEGIPPDEQLLTYASLHLQDENTLSKYDIKPQTELHMIRMIRLGRESGGFLHAPD